MQLYNVFKYFGNNNLDEIIINENLNVENYENVTDLFFIMYVYEINLINLDNAIFCAKNYINSIGEENLKFHEIETKIKYNL